MAGSGEGGALRVAYVQACEGFGGSARQASVAIARLADWDIEVAPVVGPHPLLCRWLAAEDVRGAIVSRAFPPGWPDARGAERWALPRRYLGHARRVAREVAAIVDDGSIDVVLAAGPFAWLAAT